MRARPWCLLGKSALWYHSLEVPPKAMNGNQKEDLSARELEILQLVSTGATNLQVARTLFISPNTVKTHLRNIFFKLNVESRTEATLYAVQRGLVHLEGYAPPASETTAPAEVALAELRTSFEAAQSDGPYLAMRGIVLTFALGLSLLLMLWPAAGSRTAQLAPADRLMDASVAANGPGAVSASRWSDRSPMISPVGRFALAYFQNTVYIIGGAGRAGVTAGVQMYNPVEDSWSTGFDKPTAAANIGAAVIGDLIYVPGGVDADGSVLNVLEILDPATGEWQAGPPLPVSLCSYAIAADADGLYLFGGWNGDRYVDSVLYYHAATGVWSQVATMDVPVGYAAAAVAGDRIYVTGGYDGEKEYATLVAFDAGAAQRGENPWHALAPMPEGRAGHAATPLLGHLYVLGGGWQRPLDNNARYDVANDSWSTLPSPFVGEWRTLGATSIDTSSGLFVYAFGGWHGAYLADVQAYQAFYRLYLP